jgi:hypothetical protein
MTVVRLPQTDRKRPPRALRPSPATDGTSHVRRPLTERLWRIGGYWWAVLATAMATASLMFATLALFGTVDIAHGGRIFLLRDALKDTAEISLKMGAVVGGIIGIYRYWYKRYEPLVYFTTCGPIPMSLLQAIDKANPDFRRPGLRRKRMRDKDDPAARQWHELPIIVLHRPMMELLGLRDGDQADLEFHTATNQSIWAISFVFAFPDGRRYTDWPIGLSLSLRQFFGIERPDSGLSEQAGARVLPPNGWHKVFVNARDYFRLSERAGENSLVWLVADSYTPRFRDRDEPFKVHPSDDLDATTPRVLEFLGISLRVFRRNAVRYHA